MPVVKPVERMKDSKGRKVAKLSETGREILESNMTVTAKGQGCTICTVRLIMIKPMKL